MKYFFINREGINDCIAEREGAPSKHIYLVIYFWLCWVFIAALWLSLVTVIGGYSLIVVHGLLIAVASLVAGYIF